jgi:DNA repair protein RadC
MGAVALREERQSLTIDSPEAIADLCSEMRFLDREWLRVVLLNAKQHLMKVCTVSQGSVNESLAHPREVFKPAIVLSAYSFIMVHNHPSGDPSASEADIRLSRRWITPSLALRLRGGAAISALRKPVSFPDAFLTNILSPTNRQLTYAK